MANEYSKTKLRELAARVQLRALTQIEESTLDAALEQKRPVTRDAVKKLLSESLGRADWEISVRLSSHNDSERIIDDIINQLGK